MSVREPVVAGQFYPAAAEVCRASVERCLDPGLGDLGRPAVGEGVSQAQRAGDAIGGIVPHAGWVYSGSVAGEVMREVLGPGDGAAPREPIDTVIIFGAVHRLGGPYASVYVEGAWRTPLGEIAIDEPLARAVVGASPVLLDDAGMHRPEHSIEVEVPFVRHLAPSARLLPVLVPPTASAHEIGRIVAGQAAALGRRAVFLGSSDLTHYGPRYHFAPSGTGERGLIWSKEVNDRRILDLILAMEAEQVVGEAMAHRNACGGGAIAATIAACRFAGADRAALLRHVTSNEILGRAGEAMEDAVGYAGVIFLRPQMPAQAARGNFQE
jgi:MEMO1 family protein